MTVRMGLAFSVAVAAALCSVQPASARSIVIDKPEFLPGLSSITPCTIGAGVCAPIATGLAASGFETAYIYDRGIVSFGSALPDTVDASTDLTTLSMPVIAPLYEPGAAGVAGPFTESAAGTVAPGSLFFDLAQPTFGSDLFVITFLDPAEDDPSDFLDPVVALIIDASTDEVRFQFVHGMAATAQSPAVLPSTVGREFGYSIDGQSFIDTTPDLSADNAFSVRIAEVPSVPEPATWLAMLVGFGAMGLAFRRRRASLAPALQA